MNFSPGRPTPVDLMSSPAGYPEFKWNEITLNPNIIQVWSKRKKVFLDMFLPVLILINHNAPMSNTPIRNPPKAIPRTPDRPKSKHGQSETQT